MNKADHQPARLDRTQLASKLHTSSASSSENVPNNTPKTRIYIVDDHVLIRYGLRMAITEEPDMEVCGEAEDAARGLQQIVKLQPDLVLVDISLKGNSGLELVKSIRAFNPQIAIIVVSMHAETIYGLRAIKAGARGYVMKQEDSDRVITAIRRVREGGVSVSDALALQMLHRSSRPRAADDDDSLARFLSDRELEIVNLIGNGMTTQEIAVKLHVSVKTVETHRAHVKDKLNLKNGTQLVHTCVRWVQEHQSTRQPLPSLGAA
jgi:DNA-binding NarL/FixJ family response regulator